MVQEQELWIEMDDGASLFIRRWSGGEAVGGDDNPRAVLNIIHGMAEHSGRYNRLAQRLVKEGIEVWAADQRGHGKTAGNKNNSPAQGGLLGHCADGDGFSRVCRDVDLINRAIQKERPGIPLFLLGHSWGSFIAQSYMENYEGLSKFDSRLALAGCILSGTRGPVADISVKLGAPLLKLLSLIMGQRRGSKTVKKALDGSYNKSFRPSRTGFDWLSRDEKEVDAYLADPLCGFLCSIGFYRDMSGALTRLHRKEEMEKIRRELPVYIFSGSADPVGDMGESHAALAVAYRHLQIKDLETVLYPDARHETLNETNRDEVIESLVSWLQRHLET